MTQQQKKTSGIAIASLVCGCFFFIPFLGTVLGLTAVILGAVALNIISQNKETTKGNGLAIAGIILGIIGMIFIIFFGILAAIVIPRFVDLSADARQAAEEGIVGSVRSGIYTYYAENWRFPSALDSALDGDCTTINPCFGNILEYEITEDWTKRGNTYTGPDGGSYTYNSSDGSFE